MTTTADPIPKTMRALVLKSTDEPPTVEIVPTPLATLGSAVVRVLSAGTLSYMRNIYNGARDYQFPTPLIPGSTCIGRVVSTGPDATKLKPGDLVLVDILIRSRDEPGDLFLGGIVQGGTAGSEKLMRDVFRDWTFAEYCRVPLENTVVLNEARLTNPRRDGGLGYSLAHLLYGGIMMVPYGGLRDIGLEAGQTVIIAPATGPFGGAAVCVALAMGARVVAMGRNAEALSFLKSRVSTPDRVETVQITGNMEADCEELKKYGPIDAFYDIGPREAVESTHFKSCILALRHGGRVSIMGGYLTDMPLPHRFVMRNNIRIQGKWMYEREDIPLLLKMIENGVLDLNVAEVTGEFPLEQWKEAWDNAAENARFGQLAVIKP